MPQLNDKCTICRRHGKKLFLKGERCATTKCAIVKRNFPPGAHGEAGRRKITDFGRQLMEKQTAKRLYNLRERQFSNYVQKAMKKRENTANMVVQFLESRLDNVIYRLGWAMSRKAARQFVGHGFVYVNGKKVDIPSFGVRPKDVVALSPKKINKKIVEKLKEQIKGKEAPSWMHHNKESLEAKIIEYPKLEESEREFDVKSVVEFYSR